MADIPAALVVLASHLTAAGAALTDPLLDVDRGFITGAHQLRYYWSGEVPPPHMGAEDDLSGRMIGERFGIAASWALPTLGEPLVASLDIEMQTLAGEIRTRIQGDSQLGGNVVDLDLGHGDPSEIVVGNTRMIVLRWDLDLSYVEYAKAP